MSVLKARREKEVDANSNITENAQTDAREPVKSPSSSMIELTPLSNKPSNLDNQTSHVITPSHQITPVVKKTEITTETAIKVSSVLRPKSQENGFSEPKVETKVTPTLKRTEDSQVPVINSILKGDWREPDIKPVSVERQAESQGKPKPSSVLRKENIKPAQIQQSSTFIMVTSSVRKPTEPHVQVTTTGQTEPVKKPMIQRSETLKDHVDGTQDEANKAVKPILRKAKTVDVSVWDPELTSVLEQRRQREGLEKEEETK